MKLKNVYHYTTHIRHAAFVVCVLTEITEFASSVPYSRDHGRDEQQACVFSV